MKILMISTFPSGGATIAARRQVEALQSRGIECSLVCIVENSQTEDVHITRDGHQILINVPTSSWNSIGLLTTAYCRNNRTDVSNTWFSFWPAETSFDDHLLQICSEFDVIHFHWISQMVSTKFINQLVKQNKLIAFTSHDLNHFTGGCHYSAGCRGFEKGCDVCPQLLSDPVRFVEKSYKMKIAALGDLNAVWIFPSQWLLNEFVSSKLSKKATSIKLLRNCLDIKKFTYLPEKTRENKRLELGFFENDLVFIAGAADNTEKRKGFEYLESGIQQLSKHLNKRDQPEQRLVIVTFGYGKPTITIGSSCIRHQHLGAIDEDQMVSLLQSSDLMIFPSIEENFSNIILESLMCGCPVLGFSIGGVPDIVVPNINGSLVSSIDHSQFGDAIIALADTVRITKLRKTTEEWRDVNAEFYSYNHISNELMDAYRLISPASKTNQDQKAGSATPTSSSVPSLWSARHNKANMHLMLTENILRYVKNSNRDKNNSYSENVKIDAVFNGFSEPVKLDNVGRATWLLIDNSILFRVNHSNRPALCFQIANVDWIVNFLNKALSQLQASTNSKESQFQVSADENGGKFIYLWVVPGVDSLVQDDINCLKLNFKSPSTPYENDPRGLCILFSQVTLFDLDCLDCTASDSLAPDYATSRALNLKVSQTEFIWDGWEEKTNEMAYLPCVISMWSEVLSNFDGQVEKNG